ncbi:MAG: DUF4230 domain-containing protein [Saprospiraceae bacterium]|nr:DUF4230 domain-containing protein [Saprospiraceae bacterium]
MTYLPAEFNADLNEEEALVILSNPNRFRKEFNQLVQDFNLQLLHHVANRMGLSEIDRSKIEQEYSKHHSYIEGMYYNDFIALKDTTSSGYKIWYGTEMGDAVDYFYEVCSKYTCFLVNLVITAVVYNEGGKIAAKGNKVETPCGIALTEGLRPMIKRLEERAAIDDFSRSKNLIQKRIDHVIAELALIKVEDTKALSRSLQTRIWGYPVSSTNIEISAISYVKVGFDLNKKFDLAVDTKGKFVTITLPQPTILSMEVHPRIDKMDIGWMRELKSNDMNKDIEALTEAFRDDVINTDVFSKAKREAVELLDTILGPLVASLGKSYKMRIQFDNETPTVETISAVN